MEEIKAVLDVANAIVITAHKSPDGDAIGSSLALYHYLKNQGKEVSIIVPDEFPTFLNWMGGSDEIILYDSNKQIADELVAKADVIFSLDYNNLSRISDLRTPVERSEAKKIVIDHHQEPQDFADHYFVDTDSCSTCQLVYEFIESLNGLHQLDKVSAACIYCGIMTDTGSFRYPSTTSKTHRIIAHLIDIGVENAQIHQAVYDSSSEERVRLLGYVLTEKMIVLKEFNAAYISLSMEELDRFSFQTGDTEGVVNYALSIKGIKFAALITEKKEMISLSFRSKDDVYVNTLAKKHFNGGGHVYAAGGTLYTSLDDAIGQVETVIRKM